MRVFQLGAMGMLLLASACVGGAETDTEEGEVESSVQNSLETWRELKGDRGASYVYTRSQHSWTGSGFKITVEVVNDVAVTRSYEGFTTDPKTGDRIVTETWQEAAKRLGSHDLTGYEPVPIETLYDRCLNEVLQRGSADNDFVVSFHEDGVLEACVSIPQNCADDCADGVGIDTIAFAK